MPGQRFAWPLAKPPKIQNETYHRAVARQLMFVALRAARIADMFTVDEATAAAIRHAAEDGGELAGVVELRRHFPLITDNADARRCVRVIAGWRPADPPRTADRPRRQHADAQAAHRQDTAETWRKARPSARSRSPRAQTPSSLSAPVSVSRRCWRCCTVRLLQTPGRLGRFGGCIQPAIGRTIRSPRRRTICSWRSVRPVAASFTVGLRRETCSDGLPSTRPSFAPAAPRVRDSPRR